MTIFDGKPGTDYSGLLNMLRDTNGRNDHVDRLRDSAVYAIEELQARLAALEQENLGLQTRLATTAVQLAISENKVEQLDLTKPCLTIADRYTTAAQWIPEGEEFYRKVKQERDELREHCKSLTNALSMIACAGVRGIAETALSSPAAPATTSEGKP